MLAYIVRRLVLLIPVLLAISFLSFTIIDLPPGDYVSALAAERQLKGTPLSEAEQSSLRDQYNLDENLLIRYGTWLSNILFEGDFGRSFAYSRPVSQLLIERVPLTAAISLLTMLLVFAVAIPIGIYSATHKYSFFDYFFTSLGFLGIAVPSFLLALVLLWVFYALFGVNMSGLFSQEFVDAPWSLSKVGDLLSRIWFPVIILGVSGTAGLIRVMRGNLLDELEKQYVVTARAKGVSEGRLLFRYPVRIAVNPIVSTIGWILPSIVGGEVLVSIVLSLQTTGPVLMTAVLRQDVYLAASMILILSVLTVVGTLLSDLLLAWLDPRIRLGGGSR